MWWAATIVVWLISAAWILFVMADVFRGKNKAFSTPALTGYAFHGVTAVLTLFLLFKALGA